MDYTSIFTLMRAEVTLTAILVLVFLYDLVAGERGRCWFSAVTCGLLLLSALHMRPYSLLIISRSLTLHKGDGSGRAGRQTIAQSVAVIIPQKLRFSIHNTDSSLVAGIGADAAAVAFLLINMNHSSNHKTLPPDKNEICECSFCCFLIVQADYTIMTLINMLF